jgi:crotonobetainyl-CoA:carnitine CoA-transferase CaiB-like acyl-CoA transferase
VLVPAGVPCGPVNDVRRALADPLVAERGMVVETDHPSLGLVRQIGCPVHMGGFGSVRRRGPLLGEHTDEVLKDVLGLGSDDVELLDAAGAFGAPAATREGGGRPKDHGATT